MDLSSLAALARDHVLYTLQDVTSGTVQGLAFVKKGQTIQAKQIEFIPLRNTVPELNPSQDHLDVSGQSITCSNDEEVQVKSYLHSDSVLTDEQSNYSKIKDPPLESLYSEDLNLSESSSTNETTLDECKSQASYTSPTPSKPGQSPQTGQGTGEVKQIIDTESKVKIEKVSQSSEPEVGDKLDSSPVDSVPSASIISSLAADILSKISSSADKEVEKNNLDQETQLSLEESNRLERDNILKYFEGKRNAKEVMNEETFNQLSKPFQSGWMREVVVRGSREITRVYYRTPKQLKVKRRRLMSWNKIKDFLVEVGDTDLTVDNFSMSKSFHGFEPEFERVRNSLIENSGYGLISFSKTGTWKYDNFFEILNKADCDGDKRIKCLLCGSGFTTKGNFGRHMKMSHEPDETCEVCGKNIRPLQMQEHRAKCKHLARDSNENEVIRPVKRKSTEKITEVPLKTKKEDVGGLSRASPGPSFINMSKPVARKSLPPTVTDADTDNIDKSVKIELAPLPDAECQVLTEISTPMKDPQADPNIDTTINSILVSPVQRGNIVNQEVKSENLKSDPSNVSTQAASPLVQMATLVMTSEEGARVKMQVKVTAKVAKGMKKFGQRLGVSVEDLRFLSNGLELSGEELARGLDGANILVVRK